MNGSNHFALIFIVSLLLACKDSAESDVRAHVNEGPSVLQLESLPIAESPDLYLASPNFLSVGPKGRYFVTDRFFGHVGVISPEGRLERVIGRKGDGPGELAGASLNFPLSDSVLAVYDYRNGTLNTFSMDTGSFIRQVSVPGILRDASVSPEDSTVWLGALNMQDFLGVTRWDPTKDDFRRMVPAPPSYRASNPLAGIFNGVLVETLGDTVFSAFAGSDSLIVSLKSGQRIRTLRIPSVRRRGVPSDVVQRMSVVETQPELIGLISATRDLHLLPSGELAIVHNDITSDSSSLRASVYLTLLDSGLERACVDAVVPVADDVQPVHAFSGDTLHVLQQRVQAEAVSAVTEILRFVVSPKGCEWLQLRV